jgi:geranylgeranyl pyrophosphate synthase
MTILGLHGPDYALLVGDLMIIKGLTSIREIMGNLQPENIRYIIETLDRLLVEVCEAELMESSCRRNLDTDLVYYQKILWQSAAEMEACARLGAIVGEGSENEIQVLASIGRSIGFLLRLTSDVVDSLNTEGNLHQRLEKESIPLPVLYAANSSRETYGKIKTILKHSPITPVDVRTILQFCYEAEAFKYTYNLAKESATKTAETFHSLRPSIARSALSLMVKTTLEDIEKLCR